MKISKKITSIILTVATMTGLLTNAFAAVVDYGAELTNMSDKTYVQVFDDVPKSYWAFDYIAEMADRGVLNGYPDGNFYPENSITRAEFAKIMTSAAGLGITDDYSTEYEDVPYGDWSAPYINAAKWYLSGYVTEGGTYYYPESYALREDIAVALVKLKGYSILGFDLSLLKTMFGDWQSISSAAQPYVAVAVEQGLISGYEDGTFRGQQGIVRSEAATLLWRAYQYGSDNKVYDQEPVEVAEARPTATPEYAQKPAETEEPNTDAEQIPKATEEPKTTKLPYKVDSLATANVEDTYLYATHDNKDNLYYYDKSDNVVYKMNMKTGVKSELPDISELTYDVYADEEREVTKTVTEQVPKTITEDVTIDDDDENTEETDENEEESKGNEEAESSDTPKTKEVTKTVYEEVTKEVTTTETVSVLQGKYKDFEVEQIYYNTGNSKLFLKGRFTAYKSEKSHKDKSTNKYAIIEVDNSDKVYEFDKMGTIAGNMDNGNVIECYYYDRTYIYDVYNQKELNNLSIYYYGDNYFIYSKGNKLYYGQSGLLYEYNFSANKSVKLWDDSVGCSADGLNNKIYYAWDLRKGEINRIESDGEPQTLDIDTTADIEVNDFYNMPTSLNDSYRRMFITNDESFVFYDKNAGDGTWRKIEKR